MSQTDAVDVKEKKQQKKKTGLSRFSIKIKNAFSKSPAVKRLQQMKESNERLHKVNKNHGEGLVDETQKTKTDTLFIIKHTANPTMPKGIKMANPEQHPVLAEDSRILATEFGITHGFKNGGKVKTIFSKLQEERDLADFNVMEYAYKNPEAFIMGLYESHHNLFQKNIFFGETGKSAKGLNYVVGLYAIFYKKGGKDITKFCFVSKEFNDELGPNDHFIYLKK